MAHWEKGKKNNLWPGEDLLIGTNLINITPSTRKKGGKLNHQKEIGKKNYGTHPRRIPGDKREKEKVLDTPKKRPVSIGREGLEQGGNKKKRADLYFARG